MLNYEKDIKSLWGYVINYKKEIEFLLKGKSIAIITKKSNNINQNLSDIDYSEWSIIKYKNLHFYIFHSGTMLNYYRCPVCGQYNCNNHKDWKESDCIVSREKLIQFLKVTKNLTKITLNY